MITTQRDRELATFELAALRARVTDRERELETAARRGASRDETEKLTDEMDDLWAQYDLTASRCS